MEQLDSAVRRVLADVRRTMDLRADPPAPTPGDPPPEAPLNAKRSGARSACFREEVEQAARSCRHPDRGGQPGRNLFPDLGRRGDSAIDERHLVAREMLGRDVSPHLPDPDLSVGGPQRVSSVGCAAKGADQVVDGLDRVTVHASQIYNL